jgi:hypothetical protein
LPDFAFSAAFFALQDVHVAFAHCGLEIGNFIFQIDTLHMPDLQFAVSSHHP